MAGSKLVVLVPNEQTRERIRMLAGAQAIPGLQTSVLVARDRIDACVRDTRRSLFEGPLAVLTDDDASALAALDAGADEAFALDAVTLDARGWVHLVGRAQLRSEARRALLQRSAALGELERVCALGRLVSGVADELTSPLNSALLSLQMLKRELDPLYAGIAQLRALSEGEGEIARSALLEISTRARTSNSTPARALEVLADVTESCESIAQVASDLGLRELGLRAPEPGQAPQERYEYLDLREKLDKILRLFRRSAANNTHIDRDYADDLPEVLAPCGRISQVLISMLANSLANLRSTPNEVHRLRVSLRADDALVTVTVSDTGPGLRTDLLEHVFDSLPPPAMPPAQSGGSLELSAARAILRSLGGDLMVESLRGEGATYVACLPRPKPRDAEGSGTIRKPGFLTAPAKDHGVPKRVVLVVEPDRQVLSALSHLLRERYEVLLALSGNEARILIASGTRPDAIVAASDDAESRTFVDWLLLERVDLSRRLLLTSDLDEPNDELVGLPWVEKPLEPAALFRGIEARLLAPLRKPKIVEARPQRRVKQG